MLNLTKGLMLATVLVYAIFAAIDKVLTGGVDIVLASAIVYACLAAAGCAVIALITHRAARLTKSPILEVDAKNWLVDTLLSAAMNDSGVCRSPAARTQGVWLGRSLR
jgi:predicted Co/Zn/Cd cation transporter (cation efflux family)